MKCCCSTASGDDRRGFMAKALAVALGAAAYGIPALTALVAFLNPWRQKSQAGELVRVASLTSLPVGGVPQRFPVIADRSDAWNRYPAEPIGAVFLRRIGEKEIVALHVICPHAGCFVGFDPKSNGFFCPCHAAKFDIEGKRSDQSSMSPRDLDTLEVEIRNAAEVWVKFEKFQTGTAVKTVKS